MASTSAEPRGESPEDLSVDLSTAPKNDLPPDGMKIGFTGWLRWMWRQLTSMRTALLLLFLLAIASIPGSVLPQRPVDPAKVNPNGSGISLGHPIGATGALITVKALYELQRIQGRYALVTMCIGGGQGIAAIFERM